MNDKKVKYVLEQIKGLLNLYKYGQITANDYEKRRLDLLWTHVPYLWDRYGRMIRRELAETSIFYIRKAEV